MSKKDFKHLERGIENLNNNTAYIYINWNNTHNVDMKKFEIMGMGGIE
ncbi:hypothetical protein [Deferribacter autotrophicus]|nr:hypothetical protein [Deferribacter autotrophicus]